MDGKGGRELLVARSPPLKHFLRESLAALCQFLVAEMLTNQQVMWKSTGLEGINLTYRVFLDAFQER